MKTLKDVNDFLTVFPRKGDKKIVVNGYISIYDLRVVAREWIEQLEKKPAHVIEWEKDHKALEEKFDWSSSAESAGLAQFIFNWKHEPVRLGKITWIKHFFNMED